MKQRCALLLFGLLAVLSAQAGWRTIKTGSFIVFYRQGSERQAREVLDVLEHYRPYVRELLGGRSRRTAIVLQDTGIESNGLTDVIDRRILLFTYPPSEGELGFHASWWRLVGVHEYSHWQHLSTARDLPAFLTALFGNGLAPGNYTPSWLKEGICVVAESGISAYEGRLNEGFYQAYSDTLAQEGSLPSIVQATYNLDAFPGASGLRLYGGQFLEFLARRYGRDKLSLFFVHFSSSILSYLSPAFPALGLDRSARRVFGQPLPVLWQEWQREAARASLSYSRPAQALSAEGWWQGGAAFWDGVLYFQRRFPEKPSAFSSTWHHQLLRLEPDSGRSEVLLSTAAPFVGPLRVRSGMLYYALAEIEGGHDNTEFNRYGLTAVLYGRDLEGRRSRVLLKEPLRCFEVLSDGAILTARDRRDAFGSEIWLHDSGSSTRLLLTDVLVADLAADGGGLYVSARRDWRNFNLYRIDIPGWDGRGASLAVSAAQEARLTALQPTPFQESELCLAAGRLFYSANYGLRRTIYELDPDSGTVSRAAAADFARYPAYDQEGDRLYYFGLGPGGFNLYREQPLERRAEVPSLDDLDAPAAAGFEAPPALADSEIRRGGYGDNLLSLAPRSLYPVLALDPLQMSYLAGAGLAGTSALGDLRYSLIGSYDSTSSRPRLDLFLQSTILAPLVLALGFISAEDQLLTGSVELPLYRSLRNGLSHLAVGLVANRTWAEDESWGLEPILGSGLQADRASLAVSVSLPWQHYLVSSPVDLYAVAVGLQGSLILAGTELRARAVGLQDLQRLASWIWSLPLPRGYSTRLEARLGVMAQLELSIPLARLRGGLWNPGIYFGDLFLLPFLDFALNQDGALQLAYGGELHLELKAGAMSAGYPLDLSLGFALNLEGRPTILLGLGLPGLASGYLAASRPGGNLQTGPR